MAWPSSCELIWPGIVNAAFVWRNIKVTRQLVALLWPGVSLTYCLKFYCVYYAISLRNMNKGNFCIFKDNYIP